MTSHSSMLRRRGRPLVVSEPAQFASPDSQLVSASQFYEPEFKQWLSYYSHTVVLDRKVWEYCFIMHALDKHVGLGPGQRGLVFGAGKELIPSILAARGCNIVATDYIPAEAKSIGWETRTVDDLYFEGLITRARFDASISFREVDMNAIPSDLRNFDFTWSTGSLEHIGCHANGLRFVEEAMACLRPGGIAVHTTEFTLTSESVGHDSPDLSFYCRNDILALAQRLTEAGHLIVLNFQRGTTPADMHVDVPPYHYGRTLLAHQLSHVITSIGLVIQKDGLAP